MEGTWVLSLLHGVKLPPLTLNYGLLCCEPEINIYYIKAIETLSFFL